MVENAFENLRMGLDFSDPVSLLELLRNKTEIFPLQLVRTARVLEKCIYISKEYTVHT